MLTPLAANKTFMQRKWFKKNGPKHLYFFEICFCIFWRVCMLRSLRWWVFLYKTDGRIASKIGEKRYGKKSKQQRENKENVRAVRVGLKENMPVYAFRCLTIGLCGRKRVWKRPFAKIIVCHSAASPVYKTFPAVSRVIFATTVQVSFIICGRILFCHIFWQ